MLKDKTLEEVMALVSQSIFKCKKNLEEEYAKLELEEKFSKNENIEELVMESKEKNFLEELDDDYEILLERFKALESSYIPNNELMARFNTLKNPRGSHIENIDEEDEKNFQARLDALQNPGLTSIKTEEDQELSARVEAIRRTPPSSFMELLDSEELRLRTLNLRG